MINKKENVRIDTEEIGFQAGQDQSIDKLRQAMSGCESFLLVAVCKFPDDTGGGCHMKGGDITVGHCIELEKTTKRLIQKASVQALHNSLGEVLAGFKEAHA